MTGPRRNGRRQGDFYANGFPDQNTYGEIRSVTCIAAEFQPRSPKKLGQGRWGLRVLKAKANAELVGQELWGEDATFTGLVSLCGIHTFHCGLGL